MDEKTLPRFEKNEDGSVTFHFVQIKSLYRVIGDTSLFERLSRVDKKQDTPVLNEKEREILASLFSTVEFGPPTEIRVGTALQEEGDSFSVTEDNIKAYSSELREREPTDTEAGIYENSPAFSPPETVQTFTIPPLDEFEPPISFEDNDSVNDSQLAQKLQRRLEEMKWVSKKLRRGNPNNLPVEWTSDEDEEIAENKGNSRGRLNELRRVWRDVFGVDYDEFFIARHSLIRNERLKFNERDIVALSLVEDSEDETYCKYCGRIDSIGEFLHVEDKSGTEKRVCESCAYISMDFDDDKVSRAKDKKAIQNGGQRVFHDNYEPNP